MLAGGGRRGGKKEAFFKVKSSRKRYHFSSRPKCQSHSALFRPELSHGGKSYKNFHVLRGHINKGAIVKPSFFISSDCSWNVVFSLSLSFPLFRAQTFSSCRCKECSKHAKV